MAGQDDLTQRAAADLCSVHRDTIRRRRRQGELPNSRQRSDGTVEVAVADLVAAGLLDPLAAPDVVQQLPSGSRAALELTVARMELAVTAERLAQLTDRLARAEKEVLFLRDHFFGRLLAGLVAGRFPGGQRVNGRVEDRDMVCRGVRPGVAGTEQAGQDLAPRPSPAAGDARRAVSLSARCLACRPWS
jgi:hypothetical protein